MGFSEWVCDGDVNKILGRFFCYSRFYGDNLIVRFFIVLDLLKGDDMLVICLSKYIFEIIGFTIGF